MARTSRLLTGSLLAFAMVFVAACGTSTSTAKKATTDQSTTTAKSATSTATKSSDSEKGSEKSSGDAEKPSGSFCDQAAGYTEYAKKQLGTVMSGIDMTSGKAPDTGEMIKNMGAMMHNLDDYFSTMASAAPGPIKDDMGVIENAMGDYLAALDKATTEADMEAASKAMDDPKITEAGDHVSKFAKEKCGVDFNAEPSMSLSGS